MSAFRSKKNRNDSAGNATHASNHVVHFYDEREAMLTHAASFLAGGLLRGAPAVVIVAPDRVQSLKTKLGEMGIDVTRANAVRQLILLDSAETLDQLLVNGFPDEGRFRNVVGELLTSQIEAWHPLQLHAYGDMVDLLAGHGRKDAAIELERMWDDLARSLGVALYCAYDAKHFKHEGDRADFDAICGHHQCILPLADGSAPQAQGLPVA